MRFHPRKCLFGVSLQKFDLTGSVTPKSRQKVGMVYGFPAHPGESIKTRISVKSRDIDTKLETYMETKRYTLDFGSKVIYHEIQDDGSRHYEKIQTVITRSLFVRFRQNSTSSFVTSCPSQKCKTGSNRPLTKWPLLPCLKLK
jgi:hypothetical protein